VKNKMALSKKTKRQVARRKRRQFLKKVFAVGHVIVIVLMVVAMIEVTLAGMRVDRTIRMVEQSMLNAE